jgi:hypothetical protein
MRKEVTPAAIAGFRALRAEPSNKSGEVFGNDVKVIGQPGPFGSGM